MYDFRDTDLDDNVHPLYDDPRLPEHPYATFHTPGDPESRLHHLVFVDGRLVDSWSADVFDTIWAEHARRHDEEARRNAPTQQPAYVGILTWLDSMVGGREALEALHDAPIGFDPDQIPPLEAGAREIHAMTRELVDAVCERYFGEEDRAAMEHALARLCAADPRLVRRARTPAQIAAGIVWAVGSANGLVGTGSGITQKELAGLLGHKGSLSEASYRVSKVLRDPDVWQASRPLGCPDLFALGDAGLLTSRTRRLLIRIRDRAFAARDAHVADLAALSDFYRER